MRAGARRNVALSTFVGVFTGCSLFVSVDDLSGGGDASDAGVDAEAAADVVLDTAPPRDAGLDAAIDAGPYLLADPCVPDSTDAINLTAAGVLDWAHWGTGDDTDVKNVASHLLGPLGQSSSGNMIYGGDPRSFSWTDGTIHPMVGSTSYGVFDNAGPMTLGVSAAPERRVLTLYLGTYSADSQLSVVLDPGPTGTVQTIPGGSDLSTQIRCTIHFSSPVPSTLRTSFSAVSFLDSGAGAPGNLAIMSATVSVE